MLESPVQIFSCEIGKVLKNIINRKTPVAGSVVFSTKQLNIQCYDNNFGLKAKLSRKYCNYYHSTYTKILVSYQWYTLHTSQSPNFITQSIIYFCIMSTFLNGSDASHSNLLHVIVSLSKTDCPIYQEENSPVPEICFWNYSLANKIHLEFIMAIKASAIESFKRLHVDILYNLLLSDPWF